MIGLNVCSGWIETEPLVAREQSLVIEGVRRMLVMGQWG
jgi:hypothetical protein